MKNVVCIALACIVVLSFSAPAFCERNSYLTGFAGYVSPIDTDVTLKVSGGGESSGEVEWEDDGYTFGVAIGFKKDNFRFEGEGSYLAINSDGDDVDSTFSITGLMFNGYYDFETKGPAVPYLTFGVGLGSANFDIDGGDLIQDDMTDAVSLIQVGAGLAYEIKEFLFLDFRYRYLVTSEIEFEGNEFELDFSFSSHNILVGITKYF